MPGVGAAPRLKKLPPALAAGAPEAGGVCGAFAAGGAPNWNGAELDGVVGWLAPKTKGEAEGCDVDCCCCCWPKPPVAGALLALGMPNVKPAGAEPLAAAAGAEEAGAPKVKPLPAVDAPGVAGAEGLPKPPKPLVVCGAGAPNGDAARELALLAVPAPNAPNDGAGAEDAAVPLPKAPKPEDEAAGWPKVKVPDDGGCAGCAAGDEGAGEALPAPKVNAGDAACCGGCDDAAGAALPNMPVDDAAGAPKVKGEEAAGAGAPKAVDALLEAAAVDGAAAGLNVKPLGVLSVPEAAVDGFVCPPKSDEPFAVLAAEVPLLAWLPNAVPLLAWLPKVNGVADDAGALTASVVLVDGDSCMLLLVPAASLFAAAGAGVAGAAPNRLFGAALGVPKPPNAGVEGAADDAGLSAADAPKREPPLAAAGFAPKLNAGVLVAGAAGELAGAALKPPKLNAGLGASVAPLVSAAAFFAGASVLFASSSSSAARFLGAPKPPKAGVAAGAELGAAVDAGIPKLKAGCVPAEAGCGGFGASAVAALPKKFGTGPDFFSSRGGAAAGAVVGMLKKLEAPAAAGAAFASSLFFAASLTAAGANEKRGFAGRLLAADAGGAA